MPRGALFCITLLAIAAGCEVAPGPHRAPPATADTTGSAAAGAGSSAPGNPTPAPPGNPTPAPTTNPPTATPPPANNGAGSAAAAVPPPPGEPKDSCVKVANHIAELQSASLTDPSQKETFDKQRDQVVAQVAAGCTAEAWSDAVVDCINNAQAISALTPCSDLLRKEREVKAPAPPPGAAAPTPPPPPSAAQH